MSVESKPIEASDASSEVPVIESLNDFITLINKATEKLDPRYIVKVFRLIGSVRNQITADVLIELIESQYPEENEHKSYLISTLKPFVTGQSDVKMEDVVSEDDASKSQLTQVFTPEVDMFVHLLVQIFLHDTYELKALDRFNASVLTTLKSYNLRTLDNISSKIWFYILRSKELLKDLYPIRSELLIALRSATLRHDTETRASIITLLLRNYLLTNDINQAYNLVEKTEFPENASNSLVARYYYYLARIQAIQLDYSAASECVITAIRKCPQTKSSVGFLQSSNKLSIIIQLLTGEIPELLTFRDPVLEKSLQPYFAVTKAVRLGDLKLFNDALEKYGDRLKKDDNYNLVLRLRQNVIKAGIRMISLTYKRISLKDICIKLGLDSELSAEYIVGKAIKDGVIDATVNHTQGYMQSKEILDVYSTPAPQEEFDRRIKFCIQLHNESVKAMRYPMSTNRIDLKADIEAREREQELLQYLQDTDADDFL
ncbi:unnamed protein product [[Candida] boidinii]|nr:hypothetical protein BVG19_g1981 [[Candida] boidinii]OWB49418.1 hypothetical protein B5S27_g959 [[Candida] boidinii]GME96199.1 unnamed protein product [[Candida] boidinii]